MKVSLLRPVTDGAGEHKVGSECDFPDLDAIRLIKLGAAVKIEERVPQKQEVSTGAPPPEGEDEFTEEEYQKVLAELTSIDAVTQDIAEKMVELGLQSIGDVASATEENLLSIEGVGKKTAKKIIASAQSLVK